MNCVRAVLASGGQTLRKWSGNYRIWMVCILNTIFVSNYIDAIYKVADISGYAVTPWVFPFIDSQIYIRILIYIGVILLFCDAPFIDQNQTYVIYRSGRIKYAIGQIFSITIMNMIYFLILMLAPVVLHIKHTGFSMEWGDVIKSAASTNVIEVYTGSHLLVPNVIIKYLSPIQAMVISYVFHVLTGVFLGCVIYFGNTVWNNRRGIGTLCAGILVIIDPILIFYENWYKLSPVSWGRLDTFDYLGNSKRFSMSASALMLIILIIVLLVLCLLRSNKEEIYTTKSEG